MIIKDHTRIDLAQGGTQFKQGDHVELAFTPRDAAGKVVDLTGKDIEVSIWNRGKGVIYQGNASFDSAAQLIRVTIKETLDHGKFQIEFTVTDSTDSNYRRKFPSDEYNGVINITPSTDNMDVVGVQMTTVTQLKNEFKGLQTEFAGQVLPRVNTVESKQSLLEKQFDAAAGALTEDSEVAAARMGEDSLVAFNRKTTAQLAETFKKTDTGVLSLNAFTEEERAVIQGLQPGEINAVLGERNVKPRNTDFLTPGKNLYDKTVGIVGKLITKEGVEQGSVNYSISEYIAISPNTLYTRNYSHDLAFYDAGKNYISGIERNQFFDRTTSFVSPANAAFLRFTVRNDAKDIIQLEKGGSLTEYESFRFEVKNPLIGRSEITGDKLKDKEITPIKTTFLKKGKNLFNKATARLSSWVDVNGTIYTSPTYDVSALIEVEAGETYTRSYSHTLAFYDENRVFVSAVAASGNVSQPVTNTIPAGVKYVRWTVGKTVLETAQFEKGEVATPYEPFETYYLDQSKVKVGYTEGEADLLTLDGIRGTTQSYEFNADGSIKKTLHKEGQTVIREDAFLYSNTLITETRTLLDSGETLIFRYNLDTLETEVV